MQSTRVISSSSSISADGDQGDEVDRRAILAKKKIRSERTVALRKIGKVGQGFEEMPRSRFVNAVALAMRVRNVGGESVG